MSDPRPLILLTRPKAGSERFAAQLTARFGDRVSVQIEPLQEIEWITPPPASDVVSGLIFTSQNGVLGWNRDETAPYAPAFCVGPQTTELATSLGLDALDCGGDAEAVVARILADSPKGPLLHYRGQHGRGNVAVRLNSAGIETQEAICYRQIALSASAGFGAAFKGDAPVIAPLFSPRSAMLFSQALPEGSDPWVAVISPNAADRLDAGLQRKMMVASVPNAGAMLNLIEEILAKLDAP